MISCLIVSRSAYFDAKCKGDTYIFDVSQQRVLFKKYKLDLVLFPDKIIFRIDQATKLLAMEALYNIYNVPVVLLL